MTSIQDQRQSREFARTFLSADVNLGDWNQLEGYFTDLRARNLTSPADLEKWLDDLSELQAAISEEFSARYIEMTCHTDDPAREKAYLDYVENIMPRCEPEYFELSRKYLASPGRAGLDSKRFFVYDRAQEKEVAIFREENIPLQTQDEVLSQQYQKICGEMSAEFDGSEQTLPQLARYVEETNRDVRRGAWSASIGRQKQDREKLETIFDEMVRLRTQMARNAGFENFIDYQFDRLGRFDYTPGDCHRFHETVKKIVMPLKQKLREKRRSALGLEKLAPWDLEVDLQGREPLRPFETSEQLIEGTSRIFANVDGSFTRDFDVLRKKSLLDLDSRKGKAPGGYQSTLDEARLPFIFMNATSRNQDVFTLLHEGGHAFHALATREEPLVAYRGAPIEFCEVASMGMEMMACERLDAFYNHVDARRARLMHLTDVVILLPWIMRVDAMQHWMYSNPDHTRAQREEHWLKLDADFGDDLDWSVHPEWRGTSWVSKLHFFCVPLYYIEYAIAQLGALQLWVNYQMDAASTVAAYRKALALGNSRPLPELFETAGIRFAFDEALIAPLVEKVSQALELN